MKTSIVWGGSGGIGSAIVKELNENGFKVVSIPRTKKGLAEPVEEVECSDVGKPGEVARAAEKASRIVDEFSLWVYAIGDITSVNITDMEPEAWQRITDANLKGAYLAAKHSIPLLAEDAHIVFIGAVTERTQLPGLSAYVSAKTGIESFAQVLRKEERNLDVSVLRPKAVDTKFWEKVPFDLPHGASKPDEVARRVLDVYEKGETGKVDL